MSNSTFYGNKAQWDGGAVLHFSGDLTMTHVTMSGNSLISGYSITGRAITNQVINPSDGSLILRNSIVAESRTACVGGLDQSSGNLSPDGTCSVKPGDNPKLGELTGAPAYLPLRDLSPAVDAADPEYCLEADQLGTPRPQGDGCDIGAIESTSAKPAERQPEPEICPLVDQIIAANTDRAVGNCPAGNGADTIYLIRDYTLSAALPAITSDITIEGNGYIISGSRQYRIFDVTGGKLTVNNVTLTKGSGSPFGGAIRLQRGGQAIVNNVRFIENIGGDGGAIGSMFTAYVEVNNSSFVRNRSGYYGGAISMNGGGFARISNSSFVENSSNYRGGAIGSMSGQLVISNSSFIGNNAGKEGGALSAAGSTIDSEGRDAYVPIWLTHVTMLDNSAPIGAGLYIDPAPHTMVALRLRNSVIAGITARGKLCSGRLTQNLYNLIEDGSCSPLLSGDPLFEEAAEAAAFLAPSADSPLIDTGYPEVCLDADQIGTPRPLGNGCDLGAIEVIPVVKALSDCTVTPTHNLNFRDGPWGEIIGYVSYETTFAARGRTPGWFEVEHEDEGRSGWISADFVVTQGNCN